VQRLLYAAWWALYALMIKTATFFKNMTHRRESRSQLNINGRFVSRARIYDNSVGTKKERERERDTITATIYCPRTSYPRCTVILRTCCNCALTLLLNTKRIVQEIFDRGSCQKMTLIKIIIMNYSISDTVIFIF